MISKNKILHKRISRESPQILEKYGNYSLIENKETNKIEMLINYDEDIIKIVFPDSYPFTSPTLYINKLNYREMLVFRTKWYRDYMEENHIDCLCCISVLCSNRWFPAITITRIIEEYISNKIYVKKMIHTYYVRRITRDNNLCQELIDKILEYL